jgi:hypothetical protein
MWHDNCDAANVMSGRETHDTHRYFGVLERNLKRLGNEQMMNWLEIADDLKILLMIWKSAAHANCVPLELSSACHLRLRIPVH